jgi:hypothetical protein
MYEFFLLRVLACASSFYLSNFSGRDTHYAVIGSKMLYTYYFEIIKNGSFVFKVCSGTSERVNYDKSCRPTTAVKPLNRRMAVGLRYTANDHYAGVAPL